MYPQNIIYFYFIFYSNATSSHYEAILIQILKHKIKAPTQITSKYFLKRYVKVTSEVEI